MQLMFADEADTEQGRGQLFYVAGAIFVPTTHASDLTQAVEAVRAANGFGPGDALKFAGRTRPNHVTADQHRDAKAAVMATAVDHGVTFCAYVMLHELALRQGQEQLIKFGANTLLGKFNEYCALPGKGAGVVLFDRMPIQHEHRFFQEKFTRGLTFPNRPDQRLENILAYASTCDSASHISSVADIILGSFRYCVNEPDRDIAGRQLMPQVARLMWRGAGAHPLRERGLVMRPSVVRNPDHLGQYNRLRERLNGYV